MADHDRSEPSSNATLWVVGLLVALFIGGPLLLVLLGALVTVLLVVVQIGAGMAVFLLAGTPEPPPPDLLLPALALLDPWRRR